MDDIKKINTILNHRIKKAKKAYQEYVQKNGPLKVIGSEYIESFEKPKDEETPSESVAEPKN